MKLASIDVGLKRIGVAICLTSDIVTPQNAILRKNRNQAANDVNTFLKEWEIEKLIVGFPTSSQDMQNRIKHFVNLLELKIPYEFCEENMSSIEAEELIKGEIKYKRDGRVDSLAAKIILERYLKNK
ncbi:Holliday junction resolvase RuvX [Aliarcobacter butzleri]|uniref:Holliday junction resolvase RuvX n=1 Tax=Aliarcobacter butzleri TaxID=28197 RepID=UPI00125F5CB9|nr:Holliday junction resolvase RuvX [Aliarcobacter butzleri]MCT7561260.1 Holliday junction resolvase RuvX [Aliarcobacter butzleri]MCT7628371.1 Holliday junction resolvase RuvX [Aliarcobacter butzleri]UWY60428.1 Holliday junction resolvase RuvX [Aliarcobacter butzleri]